jgi:hypothetical protein
VEERRFSAAKKMKGNPFLAPAARVQRSLSKRMKD